MKELWTSMERDMNIVPYARETNEDYINRLCFSGLGLWCLKLAQKSEDDHEKISKSSLSIAIGDILSQLSLVSPSIANYFAGDLDYRISVSTFIRRVYEETGFLLTDVSNEDSLANYGRTISLGNSNLYFGLPKEYIGSHGLGVYSKTPVNPSSIEEVFIRDNLDAEKYYKLNFDSCDFEERDINLEDLEFFNPILNRAPSLCWGKKFVSNTTIARKFKGGPYYKLMKGPKGKIYACNMMSDAADDCLISCDYRRLYFSLRAHYNNPIYVYIKSIDKKYSAIQLQGFLPNREYYFLLLTAWPRENVFNKTQFIVCNEFIDVISAMFKKLGMNVR